MSEKTNLENLELMFTQLKSNANLLINANKLNGSQKTSEEIIRDILNKEYSGKCTQNGFIQPSSIRDIKILNCTIVSESIIDTVFNFLVSYTCNNLLPKNGDIVYNCIVKGVNNVFLTVEKQFIDKKYNLVIYIPKQLNNDDQKIDNIKVYDSIDVKIIKTKITNDGNNITTMAKIYNGGKIKKSVSFSDDLVEDILPDEKESDDVLYKNVNDISTDTKSISNMASDQAEQDIQDDTNISLQADDANINNDE